jgi:hypothetical protein
VRPFVRITNWTVLKFLGYLLLLRRCCFRNGYLWRLADGGACDRRVYALLTSMADSTIADPIDAGAEEPTAPAFDTGDKAKTVIEPKPELEVDEEDEEDNLEDEEDMKFVSLAAIKTLRELFAEGVITAAAKEKVKFGYDEKLLDRISLL